MALAGGIYPAAGRVVHRRLRIRRSRYVLTSRSASSSRRSCAVRLSSPALPSRTAHRRLPRPRRAALTETRLCAGDAALAAAAAASGSVSIESFGRGHARIVARSYRALKKTWVAASRMRVSVRRRCSARERAGEWSLIHSTDVDQGAIPFYDRSMNAR
jgi:hypothetical protein